MVIGLRRTLLVGFLDFLNNLRTLPLVRAVRFHNRHFGYSSFRFDRGTMVLLFLLVMPSLFLPMSYGRRLWWICWMSPDRFLNAGIPFCFYLQLKFILLESPRVEHSRFLHLLWPETPIPRLSDYDPFCLRRLCASFALEDTAGQFTGILFIFAAILTTTIEFFFSFQVVPTYA